MKENQAVAGNCMLEEAKANAVKETLIVLLKRHYIHSFSPKLILVIWRYFGDYSLTTPTSQRVQKLDGLRMYVCVPHLVSLVSHIVVINNKSRTRFN